MLDIPLEFRDVVSFRRTLGHKANHLFLTHNTEYDTVLHPVLGGIVCLVAELQSQLFYNFDTNKVKCT